MTNIFFYVSLFLLAGLIFVILKTKKDRLARQQMEEKLRQRQALLADKLKELAVMHEISILVSQTTDVNKLAEDVIQHLTVRLENLVSTTKGMFFLEENDQLVVAAHLGDCLPTSLHPDCPAKCLCGEAWQNGTIIMDSDRDCCHQASDGKRNRFGHIIIPLKARGVVHGVLCLHLETGKNLAGKQEFFESIGNQLGTGIDNAKLHDVIQHKALHDSLTGLANRRYMNSYFSKQLARTMRYSEELTIAMIDIDHFKQFNDSHGHLAGDQMLIDIAKIIGTEIRDADLISRFGGEEFILIMPQTTAMTGKTLIERICSEIREKTGITVSCGIAMYQDGMDSTDLLNKADEAMYQAKDTGRNRIVLAG